MARKKGRPTILTPRVHKAVIQAVEAGVGVVQAASTAGIGESTYHMWVAKGEKEIRHVEAAQEAGQEAKIDPAVKVYVDFAEDTTRAKAVAEAKRIRRLDDIAEGGIVVQRTTVTRTTKDGGEETVTTERFAAPDPRPDMFWLERRARERFGRRDRVEHSGPDGDAIPLSVQMQAKADLVNAIEQAARRLNGNGSTPPEEDDSRARESVQPAAPV